MTRALVTGVAGCIGSQLAEMLLAGGDSVRGVDNFSTYYARTDKERNVSALRSDPRFELIEADLCQIDADALLEGVDVVYHFAAQAGVRSSWSTAFEEYDRTNILATQRLLDAAVNRPVRRFVYASSSSVYGRAAAFPCTEDTVPRPHSPYGLTKLAGELLCGVYASNWQVPTIALRLFTVYGPRQRPDMAFHRLFEAALGADAFPLFGDGTARRDVTYVGDVARAAILAGEIDTDPGTVVNICGGESVRMSEVIEKVEHLTGRPVPIDRQDPQRGDVVRTGGTNTRAGSLLGWQPLVSLDEGLAKQWAWHEARARSAPLA